MDVIVDKWHDSYNCAGRNFFLGGQGGWASAADCMGGCLPCIDGSASLAVDWVKCDQQTDFSAHCWFGWCPSGKKPGSKSDDSWS